MKKKFEKVYQFKITLQNTKPSIWRRIQVPETYTFWDLHVAIQDAMGWTDSHLHEFEVVHPTNGEKISIGIPDEDIEYVDEDDTIPGWEQNISDFISGDSPKILYTYDFGDNWEHSIELEKILTKTEGVKYPVCLDGKRVCPPEDCGGTQGYERFLNAIQDPKHEEHEEMLAWVGGKFDPENFNSKKVVFMNPDKHFKVAFSLEL